MTSEDFFEQLQKQYHDGLPFVAYRKPNEIELKSLLQEDSTLHQTLDFTESGFVFAPFDDHEKTILIPHASSKSFICDAVSSMSIGFETYVENGSKSFEMEKQLHTTRVQKAIDTIHDKELQKVVMSRREKAHLSNTNPIKILKKLLNAYASAFVYCWFHPKVGLWLGATPETLLKVEGRRLTTMALAGTQKFIDGEEVIWQEKEKKEQQFVTDFIVENLEPLVKEIQVSETTTVKAGSLLHLKTEIRANLKPGTMDLKLILQNLHPTPAVCGLPKEKAKQFILENENYNREYYTGFLGELNFKEKKTRNSNRHNVENDAYGSVKTVSNLYVNLRCMQLKNDTAIIYIGGGITKDSNPDHEWEETVSKSEVIKSIL